MAVVICDGGFLLKVAVICPLEDAIGVDEDEEAPTTSELLDAVRWCEILDEETKSA